VDVAGESLRISPAVNVGTYVLSTATVDSPSVSVVGVVVGAAGAVVGISTGATVVGGEIRGVVGGVVSGTGGAVDASVGTDVGTADMAVVAEAVFVALSLLEGCIAAGVSVPRHPLTAAKHNRELQSSRTPALKNLCE
jgi:hypothetical protein